MAVDLNPIELPPAYNYLAPDGSEIRLLVNGDKGGLAHCTLPAGVTSKAVSHKTVEELWYFIEGSGEVWRGGLNNNKPHSVTAGVSLVIPTLTPFQFRNTGTGPLKFLITTIPPWPGEQEARPEKGFW